MDAKIKEALRAGFEELDANSDSKLSIDEVVTLFKKCGHNIYKPTLYSVPKLIMQLMPLLHNAETIRKNYGLEADFEQACELFEVTQNDVKKELWQLRKSLLGFAEEMRKEIGEVKVHDR